MTVYETDGHGEQQYHHDWQEHASCASVGSDLFFGDATDDPDVQGASIGSNAQRVKRARAVCEGCPVWRECRYVGLAETDGVWGGMAVRERSDVRAYIGLRPRGGGVDNETLVHEMRDRLNAANGDVWEAAAHYPGVASLLIDFKSRFPKRRPA